MTALLKDNLAMPKKICKCYIQYFSKFLFNLIDVCHAGMLTSCNSKLNSWKSSREPYHLRMSQMNTPQMMIFQRVLKIGVKTILIMKGVHDFRLFTCFNLTNIVVK